MSLSQPQVNTSPSVLHANYTCDAAGGQAVDGKMRRMLDVVPEHIHDRSGIFMGSYDEIEKVKAFHK
jgi:fructose-1,6-bisphosphatase